MKRVLSCEELLRLQAEIVKEVRKKGAEVLLVGLRGSYGRGEPKKGDDVDIWVGVRKISIEKAVKLGKLLSDYFTKKYGVEVDVCIEVV